MAPGLWHTYTRGLQEISAIYMARHYTTIYLSTKWSFMWTTEIHKNYEASVFFDTRSGPQSDFLEDILIVADTKTELENSVRFILNTLTELGFVINWEKSVLSPRKRVSHLGFIIDSDSMTVTLPDDKMLNVASLCTELIQPRTKTL